MTKYAAKYPHPGPRPPEEGSPGEGDRSLGFDELYRRFRERAEAGPRWQDAMRKHAIALALDRSIETFEALAKDVGSMDAALMGAEYGLGLVVVWLHFLGEKLPPELFP